MSIEHYQPTPRQQQRTEREYQESMRRNGRNPSYLSPLGAEVRREKWRVIIGPLWPDRARVQLQEDKNRVIQKTIEELKNERLIAQVRRTHWIPENPIVKNEMDRVFEQQIAQEINTTINTKNPYTVARYLLWKIQNNESNFTIADLTQNSIPWNRYSIPVSMCIGIDHDNAQDLTEEEKIIGRSVNAISQKYFQRYRVEQSGIWEPGAPAVKEKFVGLEKIRQNMLEPNFRHGLNYLLMKNWWWHDYIGRTSTPMDVWKATVFLQKLHPEYCEPDDADEGILKANWIPNGVMFTAMGYSPIDGH
jgi:hypothetical protein